MKGGQQLEAAKISRSPSATAEPSSRGQKSKEDSTRGQKETPSRTEPEKSERLATPNGPPVSLGPQSFVTPEGQVQSMLPLFSPEQTARLHEIHQVPFASPPPSWNGQAIGELGHGGAERQALPGWLTGMLQTIGSQQGEHEVRQREYMWRMHVEHGIEQLGLQLRASQHENQRLRQERQELLEALERKESSRFTTPDNKVGGVLPSEDGAEARQERRSQEDGAAAQQERRFQKDGAAAQQERRFQKDGAGAQQERRFKEDGAEAQQDQSESDSSSEEQQKRTPSPRKEWINSR